MGAVRCQPPAPEATTPTMVVLQMTEMRKMPAILDGRLGILRRQLKVELGPRLLQVYNTTMIAHTIGLVQAGRITAY